MSTPSTGETRGLESRVGVIRDPNNPSCGSFRNYVVDPSIRSLNLVDVRVNNPRMEFAQPI